MIKDVICDDKIIDMVNKELAHLGLFTSLFEIEKSIIESCDSLLSTYKPLTKEKFNLKKKNDDFYNSLFSLTIIDLLVKHRLNQSKNKYEAASTIALLQGYLDTFAKILEQPKMIAPLVFKNELNRLPFKMPINFFSEEDNGAKEAVQKNIKVYEVKIPRFLCPAPSSVTQKTPERLCTNSNDLLGISCTNCETCSCFEQISIGINFGDKCFSINLDPEMFNFSEINNHTELRDRAKSIALAIKKCAKELSHHSEGIYLGLLNEYRALFK